MIFGVNSNQSDRHKQWHERSNWYFQNEYSIIVVSIHSESWLAVMNLAGPNLVYMVHHNALFSKFCVQYGANRKGRVENCHTPTCECVHPLKSTQCVCYGWLSLTLCTCPECVHCIMSERNNLLSLRNLCEFFFFSINKNWCRAKACSLPDGDGIRVLDTWFPFATLWFVPTNRDHGF